MIAPTRCVHGVLLISRCTQCFYIMENHLNHKRLMEDAAERAIRYAHIRATAADILRTPEAWVIIIAAVYFAVRIIPAVFP